MKMTRLRNMREDVDLTQEDIGEILNITQKAYSNYETGKRSIPLDTLITMAVLFETSTDFLLEVTDTKKPYTYANRALLKYDEKVKQKLMAKSKRKKNKKAAAKKK